MSELYLTSDLLYSSQVTSAARSLGLEIAITSSVAQLCDAVEAGNPHFILIDLTTPDLDLLRLVPELRAAASCSMMIVAYGPHVDTSSMAAAKQAGCDAVYTRGQFSAQMADILRKHACTV